MVFWGGPRFLPLIVHDRYILSSLLSMICAQGMKPFTYKCNSDRIPWRRITKCGGMPSSHAAVAAALTTSLGLDYGWTSPLFQIAAVLGGIVVYDAVTLRRVVGEHTRILKETMQEAAKNSFLWWDGVGHTPFEASVGLLIGILCAVLVVRF
jgi:acid phosphatase family membrane protein YuiD